MYFFTDNHFQSVLCNNLDNTVHEKIPHSQVSPDVVEKLTRKHGWKREPTMF